MEINITIFHLLFSHIFWKIGLKTQNITQIFKAFSNKNNIKIKEKTKNLHS